VAIEVRCLRRRREIRPCNSRRDGISSGRGGSMWLKTQAMIRRPTSRRRVLSACSKVASFCGVGSWCRHWSISLAPCASEPDSCPTRGCKVLVNRTWSGVVWTIEGTPYERNDGWFAHPPFHQRVPHASRELFMSSKRRSACELKVAHPTIELGIARSHPYQTLSRQEEKKEWTH